MIIAAVDFLRASKKPIRSPMEENHRRTIYDLAGEFEIKGQAGIPVPYGSGHINETYLVPFAGNNGQRRYIFQRINHHVFQEPEKLIDNFCRITRHQSEKYHAYGLNDSERRVLRPVRSRDGSCHVYDSEGYLWRATPYIEGTLTYQIVNTRSQAYEVGKSYGHFQHLMLDFPPSQLHETIPDFHNTRKRFDSLQLAISEDRRGRAAGAREEIRFISDRENWTGCLIGQLKSGQLPTRTIHNDTKVNNLLIDIDSLEGICVTDLDTTMPGTLLYDFGDMVRTSTNTAAEDEEDESKVDINLELFTGLISGYLKAAGGFITELERSHLVFSGKLITLELAIRFLTDYLEGDHYFRTDFPDHNLVRCRSQLALVKAIEKEEDKMENIVQQIWNEEVG